MRAAILTVAILFAAMPAQAWLAERRIDRHALNCLIRRVEAVRDQADDKEIKESCRKALYHLDALYTRRGKVRPDDEIELDSKDEQRLILQAMGLAGIKEARTGFWKEAWTATKRWAWRKVKSAVYHSLPWGLIALYLWMSRKRLWRACQQWDRSTDGLPKETRRALFKGRDLKRVHARLRG